jgi:hypothetical protein
MEYRTQKEGGLSMFKEALEYRHKNNRIRVESDKIISVKRWREVNAKVSEIARILKEGEK